MAEKQFLVANGVGGVGGAQTSPSLRVCATVSCALHSMARSRTHAAQSAGSRLVFEKGLKNAQTGGAGRNSTYFWVELVEEVDNKQDSLFLFSSYRTVNVVPFYLAVFSILCCYNT